MTAMSSDEQEIRELVSSWMEATKAGDVEGVLNLMADDVVFLLPGQPPMRKSDFAATASTHHKQESPKFDGISEIQEIKVLGDWAFMWIRLTVVVTPPHGLHLSLAVDTLFRFCRSSMGSGFLRATRIF